MAEDSEWVVESIAGYLGSPEWVIPYTDFLENKCTGKKGHLVFYDFTIKKMIINGFQDQDYTCWNHPWHPCSSELAIKLNNSQLANVSY